MGSAARACVSVGAACVVAGCQLIGGIDELQLAPGGGDDAGTDAAAASDAPLLLDGSRALDGSPPAIDGGVPDTPAPQDGAKPVDAPAPPVDANQPRDAGIDSPTSCPGGYLLCDGFESGQINAVTWQASANDARQSVVVDGTRPYRGSYSLHVHVAALNDGVYVQPRIIETSTFANQPGPVHFRAFVWLSSPTGRDNDALFTVTQSGSGASGSVGFGSGVTLVDGVSNTGSNDYSKTSATPMPIGTWACLELLVDTNLMPPDASSGLLEVWLNGAPVTDITGSALLYPLVSVAIGLQFTPPNGGASSNALDLFYDEVAVSNSYIGCGP